MRLSPSRRQRDSGALNEAGGEGGGVAYLARQADENPAAFMALLGKVLPLQVASDGGGPILIVTGVQRAEDKPGNG